MCLFAATPKGCCCVISTSSRLKLYYKDPESFQYAGLFLEGFFAYTLNSHWSIKFIYSLCLFFFPCLSYASLPKNVFFLSATSTPTDVWVSVVTKVLIRKILFLSLLLETGSPFYVVIPTTQRSSRFQDNSVFISQFFLEPVPGTGYPKSTTSRSAVNRSTDMSWSYRGILIKPLKNKNKAYVKFERVYYG